MRSQQSRVPTLNEITFDGALQWFAELQQASLLFHPEDDPAEIISIRDGERVFTPAEVQELRFVLEELDNKLGHDRMVSAAYPIFMNAFGQPLDA